MRKILFFLRELDAEDIDWIIGSGEIMTLPQGQVLINEQSYSQALYILCRGELTVSIGARPDATIATLNVADMVGELSFLDARPPNATVAAASESVVLALAKSKVEGKLAEDLGFAVRFYRALAVLIAARLRRTVSHLWYADDKAGADPDETTKMDVILAEQWFDFLIKKLNG